MGRVCQNPATKCKRFLGDVRDLCRVRDKELVIDAILPLKSKGATCEEMSQVTFCALYDPSINNKLNKTGR